MERQSPAKTIIGKSIVLLPIIQINIIISKIICSIILNEHYIVYKLFKFDQEILGLVTISLYFL